MPKQKVAQRKRANRKILASSHIFSVGLYAILFVFCVVIAVNATLGASHTFEVGKISDETVTAPRDIVDEAATELAREAARQNVKPIYYVDESILPKNEEALDDIFAILEDTWAQMRQLYLNERIAENPQLDVATIDWTTVDWETFIKKHEKELAELLPEYMEEGYVVTLLRMERRQIQLMKNAIVESVRVQLREGVAAEDMATIGETVRSNLLTGGTFTRDQASLAQRLTDNNVEANLFFDKEKTEAAKEEAANAVEPIRYQKGQTIVSKGSVITEAQYNLITQLGLASTQASTTARWLFCAVLLLLLFLIGGAYAVYADPAVYENQKNAMNIAALTVLATVMALICRRIDFRLLPAFLAAIIAAVSLRRRTAIMFCMFISIYTSMLMSPEDLFFFNDVTVRMLLAQMLGSIATIFALRKKQNRGEYLLAGASAGLVAMVIYISYGILAGHTWSQFLTLSLFSFASGLVSGALAVGLLPIWEVVFSLATPTRLLELTDPSRPLLRQLMIEAPGTYHHSMMVANLGEAAAEAIGADALLVRVAAYYHDVGKLGQPIMFKENQINLPNPHDHIEPEKSAKAIIRHMTDGVKLLEKNHIPENMVDVISQHHGDSKVGYFYYKAKQENEDVNEADFTYPFKKPQTKEAGVLLLADVVEAAVRANNAGQDPELKALIAKLVKAKYDDGLLDECPLTRKDITAIIDAFYAVYKGASHERVIYPEGAYIPAEESK
ncbi:MAG: HD family phosphohydrolase [Christensenellaceae bacterium]